MKDVDEIEFEIFSWLESCSVDNGSLAVAEYDVQICTSLGKRQSNQDRAAFILIGNQRYAQASLACAVVADGMGGMREGGLAASIAISAFVAYLNAGYTRGGLKSLLLNAITHANDKVFEKFGGSGGTTLSAVLYGQQGIVGVNVGDSRIYAADNEKITRLTIDDNFAEQLKHLQPPSLQTRPILRDNRLLQFVGMGRSLQPHIIDLDALNDGVILLATDGAHFLGDAALNELFNAGLPTSSLHTNTIDISRMCGSDDNATAILAPRNIVFRSDTAQSHLTRIHIPGNTLTIGQLSQHSPSQLRKNSPISSEELEKPVVKVSKRIKRSAKSKKVIDSEEKKLKSDSIQPSLEFIDANDSERQQER